jgi:hypothetical protein
MCDSRRENVLNRVAPPARSSLAHFAVKEFIQSILSGKSHTRDDGQPQDKKGCEWAIFFASRLIGSHSVIV